MPRLRSCNVCNVIFHSCWGGFNASAACIGQQRLHATHGAEIDATARRSRRDVKSFTVSIAMSRYGNALCNPSLFADIRINVVPEWRSASWRHMLCNIDAGELECFSWPTAAVALEVDSLCMSGIMTRMPAGSQLRLLEPTES